MESSDAVTNVLTRIESGDSAAAAELFPLIYDELRRKAAWYMAHEQPNNTLQATAVVHEAYMKLAASGTRQYQSRRHFFNAAAEAMRQILVDHARSRKAAKRGGEAARVALSHIDPEIA